MTRLRSSLGGAVAVVAVIGAAAAYVLAGGEGGLGGEAAQRVVPLGPQGIVPQFVVECGYSHACARRPDRPPREPGASHLHQFFGAESVDAASTADSLRGTDTTCQQPSDTASYWAPALYDDGTLVEPIRLNAYYRPGPGSTRPPSNPSPPGWR